MFRVALSDAIVTAPSPLEAVAAAPATGEVSNLEEHAFAAGRTTVEQWIGTLGLYRFNGVGAEGGMGKSRTLCIVAVPSDFSITDLCSFLGAHLPLVEHMRILRDPVSSARFMVLLRLQSQEAADRFFRGFNGRPFSSMGSELCRVLYVAHVQLHPRASSSGTAAADDNSSHTFLSSDPLFAPPSLETQLEEAYVPLSALPALPGAAPPSSVAEATVTELPNCPVCLDRLDSHASGLLTTLCQHNFHCSCLASWAASTCPVCRYYLPCDDGGGGSAAAAANAPACEVCGERENLWMCLVCGCVGCGRYSGEHAMAHFRATNHTYAIELSSQRVWDYSGDGFVHRLIASKSDGKIVELPDPRLDRTFMTLHGDDGVRESNKLFAEKTEAVSFEYTLLLTSQLETQRSYFESMLAQLLSLIPQEDTERRREAENVIFAQHGMQRGGKVAAAASAAAASSSSSMSSALSHGSGHAANELPDAFKLAEAGVDPELAHLLLEVFSSSASSSSAAASSASAASAGVGGARSKSESDDIARAQRAIVQLTDRCRELTQRAAASDRDRRAALRQATELRERNETLSEELAFLRDLNDSLTANAGKYQKKLTEAEAREKSAAAAWRKRVADLEEQVQDLAFSLDTQAKLASKSEQERAAIASGMVIAAATGTGGGAGNGSGGSTAARLAAKLAARTQQQLEGGSVGPEGSAGSASASSSTAATGTAAASTAAADVDDDETPSIVVGSSKGKAGKKKGK
jgi:BRCA1-associated protein